MSTQVQFKDYSMGFKDDDGKVYNLIDHLNMQLDEGKALGIVGESGCGKSMTSLSLMRLLPAAASVQGGEILLNGEDLLKKSEPEMEKIRGKQIAMIFQEPMTALNVRRPRGSASRFCRSPVYRGYFQNHGALSGGPLCEVSGKSD